MSGTDRIARLAKALTDWGYDAFFASTPITMGYLQGYSEHAGERFLTIAIRNDGSVRMICPALSATQAQRSGIKDIRTWKDGEDALVHLEELAKDWNLKSSILAVDSEMPAQMLLRMQSALPAALFKEGQPVLGTLMSRKDEKELDLMRGAAKIADEAFDVVFPTIKAGQTERQIEHALFEAMRDRGGDPTFCIVGFGPNGAEPHHITDDTVLKSGDVVILDFGCSVGGYQSDITRTICCGPASEKAKQVYKIVFDSHMAGREAIKPGATGQDVDRASRKVIADAGYGEFFFHRTGHGIGMRGHEEPYIIEGNDEPLVAGNCFSIEPGIYLPGEFGVRIENIVNSTAEGYESQNVDPSPTLMETPG